MSRSMGAWTEPSELDVPQFDMPGQNETSGFDTEKTTKTPRPEKSDDKPQNFYKTNFTNDKYANEPLSEKQENNDDYHRPSGNRLLSIISSLFGGDGGLDISTLMGIINMFGKKSLPESSVTDTSSSTSSTINLNDYKRVK